MGWERKPVERETSRLLLWINQMFLKSQGKCLEFPILWKHGKLSATSGCCAKLPPLTRMQGSAPGTDALIQNVGQGISKTCISGWMDKKFCPLQFYWVFLHIASFPPFYFAAFFCISNRCFVLTLHIEQFFCHTRIPAHYRNQPQVKCGFLEGEESEAQQLRVWGVYWDLQATAPPGPRSGSTWSRCGGKRWRNLCWKTQVLWKKAQQALPEWAMSASIAH